MKKNLFKTSLLFFSLFVFAFVQGQEEGSAKATYVGKATSMITIPSISSRQNLEPAITVDKEMSDGRSSKNEVIIGKDPQVEDDYFLRNPNPMAQKIKGKEPSLVFDAIAAYSEPTDPSLAVSEEHVFVVFNTGFRIFDKQGSPLTGQLSPSSIFGSVGCCDLTVSYDDVADRWLVSMLYISGGAKLAISSGKNPLTSTWNVYTFSQVRDYQKVSIWSDGYYMTDNTSSSNKVHVIERDKMLAGDPNAKIISLPLPGIKKYGFYSPQAFSVSDENLPAPGNAPIVFLQDDAWYGISEDHIKIWLANVNWDNPSSSTMSQPVELKTAPFISVFDGGSFENLKQPGGSYLDAIQSTIMNQAQFKKFPTYNSAIFNFVIDADASSGKRAAIRWYELRQDADGAPWSIYQEGTYLSPNDKHAWMGSMIMDKKGNIGMGYTAMSSKPNGEKVSSYYTGRYANDPLNTMTIQEELISAGNQNFKGNRYGDYAKIDLDPYDNKTFWFITEYMKNNSRRDVVGVFKIAPDYAKDLGVISIDTPETGEFSANESITVSILNYGELPQSNFPVKLFVDDVEIATETFTGTIASLATATYTFTATANLGTENKTYSLKASTNIEGDEDENNDSTTKEVTHLYKNDIGVIAINTPTSGGNLGSETVKITIKNFGHKKQSNFNVSYSIDGGNLVTETVTASVEPKGGELKYEFQTKGDFSEYKEYLLKVQTNLSGDKNPSNDSMEITVVNNTCAASTNNTVLSFGTSGNNPVESVININKENVKIKDLNVKVNIKHTYLNDIIMSLIAPNGTEVFLAKRNGGSGDNFTNTVFDDDASTSIAAGTAPFTGSYKPIGNLSDFNGINPKGDWKLKIKDVHEASDSGKLLNWSIDYCYESLSTTENEVNNIGELTIANKGNKQYLILLQIDGDMNFNRMDLDVFDFSGQKLLNRRLENEGGKFSHDLNMSYAAPGVYIVRMSNGDYQATGKIIVK